MSNDLLGSLATSAGELLSPLQRAVEVPGGLRDILAVLGAPPTNDSAAMNAAVTAIVDVKKQIESLAANAAPSLDDILSALHATGGAFDALRKLDAAGGPMAQLPGFGADLAEWLVSSWLAAQHPVLHQIATLLTLIELEVDQSFSTYRMQGVDVARYSYRIERFHLNRLTSLLRDPAGVLRAAYGTPLLTGADADAMADALFPKLVGVLQELGVRSRYGVNAGDETMLGNSAPFMNHALIIYLNDPLKDLALEAGLVVSISSADRGDLGFVFSPFGTLAATRVLGRFRVDLALTAGVDVVAFGRHGLTLRASAGTTEVIGSISAALPTPSSGPGFVLGSPTGTRFEVGGARVAAETSLSAAKQRLAISADVSSSALVLMPGDSDSFLASILPSDGLRATFDLGLTWDNTTGLTLRGKGALTATFPVGLSVGGVGLTNVYVGLTADAANGGSVRAEISADLNAAIGPVKVSVGRMGMAGSLTFPASGGNLGVADLSLGLQPPTAIGLSVDVSGVLTGSGFLYYDPAQSLYAGALQLTLYDQLTLTAIGLITTTLPD
ncbi:MAG: DUF6603 domain-containing protein, partial [bacterium]